MLDVERLRALPLFEVIRSGTGRLVSKLAHAPHDAGARFNGDTPLAAVNKLEPELRRLTWLMVLAQNWMLPDKGDDLSWFFMLQSGNFAPQVRDALDDVGFAEQSQVLSEAIALFGRTYPVELDKRQSCFSDLLDRKLSTLNRKFGSRSDYQAAVETYVRGNPKLFEWAQDARPKVTENARLMWLLEQLYEHLDADSAALLALPKTCQQLLYLGLFWGEVFNGGIQQFFFNSTGDQAPEVVQTLREVGLSEETEIVRQCMDLFPASYPVDWNRRRELMSRNGEEIDKKLYEMSDRVDSAVIHRAMIDIAKREALLPQ
jgi:hypothetical protein